MPNANTASRGILSETHSVRVTVTVTVTVTSHTKILHIYTLYMLLLDFVQQLNVIWFHVITVHPFNYRLNFTLVHNFEALPQSLNLL